MTEDKIEQGMLDTLAQLGWEIVNGPTIGPDGTMERAYTDVVLNRWLDIALARLNPDLPPMNREEAAKRIMRVSSADLLTDNSDFHKLLVEGVDIEHRADDGSLRTTPVRLFDFENAANNDFVAVNQRFVSLHSDLCHHILILVEI